MRHTQHTHRATSALAPPARRRHAPTPVRASAAPADPPPPGTLLDVPPVDGEDTSDAFAELVRLAVQKDPTLAARTSAARVASPPRPPALAKPPWLRQRAPQGDRYTYLTSRCAPCPWPPCARRRSAPTLASAGTGRRGPRPS